MIKWNQPTFYNRIKRTEVVLTSTDWSRSPIIELLLLAPNIPIMLEAARDPSKRTSTTQCDER